MEEDSRLNFTPQAGTVTRDICRMYVIWRTPAEVEVKQDYRLDIIQVGQILLQEGREARGGSRWVISFMQTGGGGLSLNDMLHITAKMEDIVHDAVAKDRAKKAPPITG